MKVSVTHWNSATMTRYRKYNVTYVSTKGNYRYIGRVEPAVNGNSSTVGMELFVAALAHMRKSWKFETFPNDEVIRTSLLVLNAIIGEVFVRFLLPRRYYPKSSGNPMKNTFKA